MSRLDAIMKEVRGLVDTTYATKRTDLVEDYCEGDLAATAVMVLAPEADLSNELAQGVAPRIREERAQGDLRQQRLHAAALIVAEVLRMDIEEVLS